MQTLMKSSLSTQTQNDNLYITSSIVDRKGDRIHSAQCSSNWRSDHLNHFTIPIVKFLLSWSWLWIFSVFWHCLKFIILGDFPSCLSSRDYGPLFLELSQVCSWRRRCCALSIKLHRPCCDVFILLVVGSRTQVSKVFMVEEVCY